MIITYESVIMKSLRNESIVQRVSLLVTAVLWLGQFDSAVGECPCDDFSFKHTSNFTSDHARTGLSRMINCCIFSILGFRDENATVIWSFKGNPINGNEEGLKLSCQNQTLMKKSIELSDEGNYTCVVTSSNGTVGALTTELDVCRTSGHRSGPKNVKAPESVCAEVGEPANITCEGVVGEVDYCDRSSRIAFLRWVDGKIDFIPADALEVYGHTDTDRISGKISKTLVFDEVTEEHLGTYICNIKNSFGNVEKNVTLIDSTLCKGNKVLELSVIATAVCAFFILLIPCLWFRFGTALKLKYEMTWRKHFRDGFLRDVFIVHGDEASTWVREKLVPTLEDIYDYDCFIPERDMLGGEQYAEAISTEMARCRRVLVIITPCLLRSQWARWSTTLGIATCFKSSRIRGIVLEELGEEALSSDTTELLQILKPIEMLKYPKPSHLQMEKVKKKEKENPRKSLWEDPVENQNCLDIDSPKGNFVTNMISGSNNASRENLDERKDKDLKIDTIPTITFTEHNGESKDLGSPCSITPFILPGCNQEKQLPCSTGLKCWRVVFFGHPETRFWQKLRLFLKPPSLRRRITVESVA